MSSFTNYHEAYKDPSEIDDEMKKIVYDIDREESFQQILKMFPIVVVDAWASWCNPCKTILPKYVDLANKYKSDFEKKNIIFLKDNIEMENSVHKTLVTVVPSFFIYLRGQKYDISGYQYLEENIIDALSIIHQER